MGEALADRSCVACHGGTPTIAEQEVPKLLGQLEGWAVEQGQLVKSYRFSNFLEAIDFVNRITPVAESEGHHPDLEVGWGRVKVLLSTHVVHGLTENDFILAAKIDQRVTNVF